MSSPLERLDRLPQARRLADDLQRRTGARKATISLGEESLDIVLDLDRWAVAEHRVRYRSWLVRDLNARAELRLARCALIRSAAHEQRAQCARVRAWLGSATG